VLLLCESLEYIHEEHMALRPSASVATMLPGLRLIFNIVVLLDDVHLIPTLDGYCSSPSPAPASRLPL
jgi:hypothetical protein